MQKWLNSALRRTTTAFFNPCGFAARKPHQLRVDAPPTPPRGPVSNDVALISPFAPERVSRSLGIKWGGGKGKKGDKNNLEQRPSRAEWPLSGGAGRCSGSSSKGCCADCLKKKKKIGEAWCQGDL